jgi:voltage-gated potassium channel
MPSGDQRSEDTAVAKDRPKQARGFSNAYEMFTLVLTVLSLVIMVLLLLPLPDSTLSLLLVYDNLICVVFLVDFCLRLSRASSAGQYFFREGGWLDLLGSIPSLGVFKYTALLRLARLGRLARIMRLVRGQKRGEMMADVLAHRGQYAGFVTLMAAFVVLIITSVMVLTFESASPESNITTGGDALWWSIVTMTTVGYGDTFPFTTGGRITAVFVMVAGVGIIGSLASILASVLVTPTEAGSAADSSDPPVEESVEVHEELRAIRAELEALRRTLGARQSEP